MELRCQLERHTAALYADRAPVITNRRADAVLSFYLARARKPLFHHPPPPRKGKIREILGRNIGNTTKMYAGKFSQNLRRSAFHTSSIRKDDVETEEFKYFTINFCLCLLFSSYRFSIFVKYSFLFFFLLADKYTLYNISRNGNQSRDEWRDRYNNYRCRSFDPLIS